MAGTAVKKRSATPTKAAANTAPPTIKEQLLLAKAFAEKSGMNLRAPKVIAKENAESNEDKENVVNIYARRYNTRRSVDVYDALPLKAEAIVDKVEKPKRQPRSRQSLKSTRIEVEVEEPIYHIEETVTVNPVSEDLNEILEEKEIVPNISQQTVIDEPLEESELEHPTIKRSTTSILVVCSTLVAVVAVLLTLYFAFVKTLSGSEILHGLVDFSGTHSSYSNVEVTVPPEQVVDSTISSNQ